MTDPSGSLAAGAAADLLHDGAIDVTSWTDLAGLPDDMATLDAQFARICDHARSWVCQRRGFETSPVCLLRPLADILDLVADGVDATERLVREEWADLSAGVRSTSADLRTVDQIVADALPMVS
jgi:hypothetical protein